MPQNELLLGNRRHFDYSKSFCAFLDILGFEALVNSSSPASKEKLELYYWLVDFQQNYFQQIAPKADIKILGISDSLIMSYELTENINENVERLRHFLLAIAIIQSTFATNNIWLRGGVSIGDVCFEPSQSFIVGPGYIQAYNLEKIAKFPRVIVDVKIINELGFSTSQELIEAVNLKGSGGVNFDNWKENILFDWKNIIQLNAPLKQDVPLFIDYFSTTIKDSKQMSHILSLLKQNLLSGIPHFEKYHWVGNYLMNKADSLINSDNKTDLNDHYDKVFDDIRNLGIR